MTVQARHITAIRIFIDTLDYTGNVFPVHSNIITGSRRLLAVSLNNRSRNQENLKKLLKLLNCTQLIL